MLPTDHPLLQRHCHVNGQWRDAADGARFPVTDPATGHLIAEVASGTAADAQAALDAAQRAFGPWKDRTATERARALKAWHALLIAHQEDLARLMSWEQGKPLAEARGEVAYGAGYVEWYAEEARRAYGDVIPEPVKHRKLVVLREPVGVVAVITPWNFPLAMMTRKVAPALAAGCTVVIKPAEDTPLTALAAVALAAQAGIPPGVVNIVPAPRERAAEVSGVWLKSPVVRKLSFTGSTAVGKLLARECAGTLKKLSLELGGNAPFIVFDDADVDAAVAGAMASKYRNTGQTCVCANRLLVQDGIHDRFVQKLAEAVARLRVGPAAGALDGPMTEQGPLISPQALAKVEAHIADAVAHGARIVTGGRRHALGGLFFEPTVMDGVTPAMRVAREETFGPLAPVFRFRTEAEAIALANDTEVGLAAYFYARDIGRVWRVAQALEVGMVGINEGIISTEVAPFGGIKESGMGREGSYQGLDDYLETKYLCFGGLAA